jgi:hypothetical protein
MMAITGRDMAPDELLAAGEKIGEFYIKTSLSILHQRGK